MSGCSTQSKYKHFLSMTCCCDTRRTIKHHGIASSALPLAEICNHQGAGSKILSTVCTTNFKVQQEAAWG